ncbi:GH32 C-terminal domain-containing protein [Allostreptomyces psammosilenae]|uniref:beta-fructofuranosidase n=1 Tax=Allostreptomyces psammosilenae TaxID=1892865 RepID=A0A852ZV73_9ACTN|nr:GH32 C-terminal domain-containing protein [Allostreptomyces psammosilenae]NYI05170.1 sucrose-6-phosphate hydrolase SacC (GH32 family) [Allostreptomyces psammosilenae]
MTWTHRAAALLLPGGDRGRPHGRGGPPLGGRWPRPRRGPRALLGVLLALAACLALSAPTGAAHAEAAATSLDNPGFETGDLTGWTATGTAFTQAVTDEPGWGWGCCFNHAGRYHLWGYRGGGDTAVGTLTSQTFTLGGTGVVSLLVSGGRNIDHLYVALTTPTGTVLHKATGSEDEAYRRVIWDARAHLGQAVRITVVDDVSGGWGHINLDDIRIGVDAPGTGQPPTGELAAHWSFDEGAGAATTERVSRSADPISYVFNDAVYKPDSDPLWEPDDPAAGVLSGALLFDGYSTWVTRDAPRLAVSTEALTVEAWVAPRAFEWGDGGKPSAIVNQHDQDANQGFSLGVGRHGGWVFGVGTGDAWRQVSAPAASALRAGEWAHLTATFDPAGGAMRLYLNGVSVGEAPVPTGARMSPAATSLLIGRHNQPVIVNGVFAVNMFNGLIDEVKIHNRALGPAEIAAGHSAALDTFADRTIPRADMAMDRGRYDGDRYRPGYHFTAPNHWMNEPHAPIQVDGRYHLFYQHNPHGPYWHNISWGHAVSEDLVHWRDLPMAMVPTAGSPAPDGVWSGSATVDENGDPVLFFTAGNDSVRPNQATGLARPADPDDPDLTEWIMHPTPVTVQQPDLDVGPGRKVRYGDFRDPYVWKEGDTWFQLMGSGVQTTEGADVGGTALLYTSTNLTDWTYVGPLAVGDVNAHPATGQVWELPTFLPIGRDAQGRQRNALLINPAFSSPSEHANKYVWYWVGTWDAEARRWTPDHTEPRLLDYGDHFTGPSGTVDASGRSLLFSITQDRRTEQAHYDAGWAHNAGLPVRLTTRPDGDLGVAPVAEVERLHADGAPLVRIDRPTDLATVNQRLAGVRGDMLHIRLEMSRGSASSFGLDVLRSPGDEERTRLFYDRASGRFGVDRTRSGNNSSSWTDLGVQSGPLRLEGNRLVLDVFVDRSMVEAFANGHKSITTRAYPHRTDSLGLRVWGEGAKVHSMTVWEMTPMTE